MHGLCPKCLLAQGLECSVGEADSRGGLEETVDSGAFRKDIGESPASDFGLENRSLGDYTLLNEVARGGMGVVYKAHHNTLGREVALKLILSGEFASENDVRRFHLEAESAAALDHPGIVPIYEIGQQDGHHFFTMKFIDGGSLSDKMSQYRESTRDFVTLLIQVAEAIDYAHRRGILHRDLKPANILLDQDDEPVVTDLGLAKHIQGDSDLTGTGAVVGTPSYMPPEQATASKEVTTAADIYSLGAILYEGLTGHPPHQADSAIATLLKAAKGEVITPSQHNCKVDQILELICMKCLAQDPDDRYASAGMLAKDLRNWLSGDSVSVKAKSMAAVFGDLVSNQLRSAIGAMILGVCGGIALGVPIYCGLASRLFGRPYSRFNIAALRERLPSADIAETWWLNPPSFHSGLAALLGLLFCCVLGILIQKLVRPQDLRQAIAIGLVAGLLMGIVEFAMYGIAASWQTFAIMSADQIDLLASAGFANHEDRKVAMESVFNAYPDLEKLPEDQRAQTLSQLVATKVMLSTPPVTLSCLAACLVFAGVYCVLGTIHAFRLTLTSFSTANRTLRYFENIFVLSVAGLFACLCVFTISGMISAANGPVGISHRVWIPCLLFSVAAIPGWKMANWYKRWLMYAAVIGITFFTIAEF